MQLFGEKNENYNKKYFQMLTIKIINKFYNYNNQIEVYKKKRIDYL